MSNSSCKLRVGLDVDAARKHEIDGAIELNLGFGEHSLAVVGVAAGVGGFNLRDELAHALLLRRWVWAAAWERRLRQRVRGAAARWPAAAAWLKRARGLLAACSRRAARPAGQLPRQAERSNEFRRKRTKRRDRSLRCGITLGTMPMISYAMEDEPRRARRKLRVVFLMQSSESPSMDARFLRNFAIIAHIDHGKSTLSDRLLELTGSVTGREMQAQILDDMDLERERGITIKAHAVRMMYKARDGNTYQLNLIDTPGHVDFSYEVSRSLASCEGALLVVDASQGVEAQTLANAYLAINHGLEIIPVINKIDLPSADILRTQEAIEKAVGLDATDAIPVSAKTGQGVDEVLEAIVHRLPPPKGDPDAPLQALIFDSWFDAYRGVIVLVRVMQGTMRKGQRIRLMSNGKSFEVESMGVLMPKPVEIGELSAGEVGFFAATIKNVGDTKIGDTVTDDAHPAAARCPDLKTSSPWSFRGSTPWTRTSTRCCATLWKSCG